MKRQYFFKLADISPKKYSSGSKISLTSKELSALMGVSLAILKINPEGCYEPHWYPNANQFGYALAGRALISLYMAAGVKETFTVEPGEIFFIPKGGIHHIQNIGDKELEMVLAYSSDLPEEMFLSTAIHALSANAFGATFGSPTKFFEGLKKPSEPAGITNVGKAKKQEAISSRFKFNFAGNPEVVEDRGGYLKLGVRAVFPILEDVGLLAFGLNEGGVVEPHWHTNAGEHVYIAKGRARMAVLTPEGETFSKDLGPGEAGFAPASYFHSIENIGPEKVDVYAFFSHAAPDYIGVGGALSFYSNEVLSSIFKVAPDYFNQLKRAPGDLVIVPV